MPASRRVKPLSLIASLAASGATLLSWTMPWFVVVFGGTETSRPPLDASGEIAAPALAALGLAGLALVAALAIAGPVFRIILGVLQIAIGLSVAWSAWSAIAAPVAAVAPLVTEATGITGANSVEALVESANQTAWPVVTLLIGMLTVVVGVFIIASGRSWPGSSRKYQPVGLEPADDSRSAVSDWDSLSDGSDPTSR